MAPGVMMMMITVMYYGPTNNQATIVKHSNNTPFISQRCYGIDDDAM